jgi:polysaccharide deacetylase family protein (PEP-CTERM system associated)
MTAASSAPARIVNAMTVDVEDYFQVQAFAGAVSRADWDGFQSRVEANTDRILSCLDDAGARATFFTLGWVAERHPALVRRIVAAGHELASHGWDHTRADAQTPDVFGADVARARALLQDVGGVPVVGYRAATFSIGAKNLWAFGRLRRAGYRYSSSVYPVRHDTYGMPDAPRLPFQPDGDGFWELPMTAVRAAGRSLPCSGGGWFRLVPYRLFRAGLRRFNATERAPGIFYTHPWEVDPGQPRIAAPALSRFRHYVNLSRTEPRLRRLLADFAWDRIDRVHADLLAPAAASA